MRKVKLFLLMLVALLGTVTASAKTVYIQPNAWSNDNAVVSLWVWVDGNEGSWAELNPVTYDDGILKAVLDDAITTMHVVRGSAAGWDNKWNESSDITPVDGKLFVMGDIASSAYETQDYTEPLLRDYYLESDAALGFGGWNAVDGNKMVKGTDDKFTLSKENVLLTVGNYNYKAYCSYGSGTWYPADDNQVLNITENGFYTVTFTFDLADGEPTAVATKTEAIGYMVDFNTTQTTSGVPDFAVASNWEHIVGSYTDYWGDPAYPSYSYQEGKGMNGTTALQQLTNQKTNNIYDLLVTPIVSGTVTIYVKPSGKYYNDTAFLEFWSLNAEGTEKNEKLATTNFSEKSNSEEWDWIALTITVETPQRIGIRASQVLMDNFIATSATIVPLTKMQVSKVANADGATGTTGTNPIFNQDADGNTTVQLKVTVDNTGDVDLIAGETENYTLTLAEGTSSGATNYFEEAPFAIPVNIAAGQSATFDVEFIVPAATGYTYFYVRENIKGKTSSSNRYCQVKEYASKFIFDIAGTTYYSSSSATTKPIDFGKITSETTLNYEIYNSGSAPLVINSFSVPAPFTSDAPEGEFTVAAGEKKQIAITLPTSTAGVFAGNLTVEYTNYGKAQATYTLGISGTVIDPSKNNITFSNAANTNGQFPEGSIHSDQVYISNKDGNYCLQSTGTTTKFITPLLTAEAGESFTYDAWYSSYNSNCAVVVYRSTDRENWTQVDRQTYNTGIGSKPATFTVTIEEAGDYYLAFELLNNALLDNIYGLTLAPAPAHDWYFTERATIPATGTQNSDYTASIKVQNIASVADAVETATLYVGGEAVVTLDNVALAANDKTAAEGTGRNGYSNIENPTEISFTYKPHTFGTFKAYIELKSGDKVMTTNEVDVTIAEEKVESDLSVTGSTNRTGGPIYTWDKNSEVVSLYTADVLMNKYGLKAGDKIESITFKGYNDAGEHTTSLDVWYKWTSETELAKPADGLYDVTGLTSAISEESHVWAKEGSATDLKDMIVLTFDEPVTYDGSALRIVARDYASSYKDIKWETSTIEDLAYKHSSDNQSTFETNSWSAQTLPVIHIGLVVEPTVLAGTVTDGTNPVAGAKVTIRNEANNVEYFATTAADGSYSINVIQDQLTYKAVVDKEGLVSEVKNVEGATLDFTLAAPAYGEIPATVSAGYFKYLAQEDDKLVVTYTENPTVDRVVKFTKPSDWNAVYAYAWDNNDTAIGAIWHGTELTSYTLNEYNQPVYSFTAPDDAVGIIFNDGDSKQTVNITDFTVTGYYTDGSKDGEGHFNVLPWTDDNTAIQLCDDKGAVVADATLDNGTATVELTDAVIAKLAAGLYVTVKGTEATISKVELKKGDYIILAEDADGVEAGTYAKVKIERTFKAGWNAVVLPFEITAAEVAATFGADAEVAAYTGDEGTDDVTVKFAKKTDDIAAGTPILLWLANDVADVQFQNKEVVADITTVSDNANTFEFTGVYTETTNNAGDYIVQGGEFRQADESNSVLPFRAYLKLKEGTTPARSLNFVVVEDGGSTTGIDAAEISGLETVEGIYNLNGQKVETLKRGGLYIINGKKVVLRK